MPPERAAAIAIIDPADLLGISWQCWHYQKYGVIWTQCLTCRGLTPAPRVNTGTSLGVEKKKKKKKKGLKNVKTKRPNAVA